VQSLPSSVLNGWASALSLSHFTFLRFRRVALHVSFTASVGLREQARFCRFWAIASLAGIANQNELVATETSLFKEQLIDRFGGDLGHLIGAVLLQPLIGSWGSALILLMVLVISSIVLLTDDFSKAGHYIRERWRTRGERRAQRREAKALALAAAAEAAAAEKESAPEVEPPQRKPKRKISMDDDEPANLLQNIAVPAYPVEASKPTPPSRNKKPAISSAKETEPEPEPEKKPPLDPSMVKIVSGEKVEKAVAAIPERRGDYKFPPLDLLAEAQDVSEISPMTTARPWRHWCGRWMSLG
jgi:DNA segregation ATPase FtsK/SpoIIIE, S-DNA-T family